MTNKEKFFALVSPEATNTLEKNRWRIANRLWLNESQEIAMKILDRLEILDWSQKDLAEKMGVSPQYINKIVKGKENLTLETLIHLQILLNIPILATYYEEQAHDTEIYVLGETTIKPTTFVAQYQYPQKQSKVISMNLNFQPYSYQKIAYGE